MEQLLEAPDSLAKESAGGVSLLRSTETGEVVARVPGLALMYTDSVLGAPPLLRNLVATWGSLPKNLVLVTVRRVSSFLDPLGRILSNTESLCCCETFFPSTLLPWLVLHRCWTKSLFTTESFRCCETFLPSSRLSLAAFAQGSVKKFCYHQELMLL